MLNKLIVITAIVFLGISCAIGNGDGNNGKSDGNKGNSEGKMGSGGDWLNPNKVSSGYYPNFPWYTTGGSFYSQAYSYTTFSPFTEYYVTSGTPVVGGIISTPVKFDIAQKTPSEIYYGTGQALPYSQYVSSVPSKTNELWVQGATSWSQYVVSPVGTWLQLVANAPVGGTAGFYEVVQTDTTTQKYSTYQFNQGYNTMNFNADQVGRHMLYFVVSNQPSNVVIVDVLAQAPAGTSATGIVPIGGQNYYTPNGLTSTTSNGQTITIPNGQTTTTATSSPTSGDTPVTIVSQGMRGYQVFLDGNYIGTEGTGGDPLDGKFSFSVVGNQNHEVRVYDGQFNYPKTMFFEQGVQKIINVEPGTAVYA